MFNENEISYNLDEYKNELQIYVGELLDRTYSEVYSQKEAERLVIEYIKEKREEETLNDR